MAFSLAVPWNEGEEKMHKLLRIPPLDNPTVSMLSAQASLMLQKGSMLALGTLDAESRPWTTLWGGSPGFSEPLGGGLIGTRTLVDGNWDPVVQALVGDCADGEKLHPKDGGKMLAGLAIDLMTRKRVKIAGKMVAGAIQELDLEQEDDGNGTQALAKQKQIQLVTKIEQSLGNCPKYINQYQLQSTAVNATKLSESPSLTNEAKALISRADMFFLTTSTEQDMDVNHRGGSPGFVRVLSPTAVVYPEYSGNRLYQSLGNIQLNPKIGMTFPDYRTGDVLYVTGIASIFAGAEAANLLPGSTLAVKIDLASTRHIQHGLPFRGTPHTPSPYNPRVRPLACEGNIKSNLTTLGTATLTKKTLVTPSIARFTFSVSPAIAYTAGQWIALDFKEELDIGYEHMRDDDPASLNDDFVRTFTISSPPSTRKEEAEFELTIRNVGSVTKFMFKQNDRAGLEVPVLGVGGDFTIVNGSGVTPFVAGGVGITPLLGHLHSLDTSPERFRLFWTLRYEDAQIATDTFRRFPQLGRATRLFFTGAGSEVDGRICEELKTQQGVGVHMRRLTKEDLADIEAETWYMCAGRGLREHLLGWLDGKHVVFEGFDY